MRFLIVYALLMGLAQAFVTPARDGLLNLVAGNNVQRMVVSGQSLSVWISDYWLYPCRIY